MSVFLAHWGQSTGTIGIVIPGHESGRSGIGLGPALCKKRACAASLALQPLMEGLITGCVHRPYHACPLSAPHWIIPEGGICTPSIIYSITRANLCFSFSVSHEKAEKKSEMEGAVKERRGQKLFHAPQRKCITGAEATSHKSTVGVLEMVRSWSEPRI